MRLEPIEHPHGLKMRLAYLFSHLKFGKTLTPPNLPLGIGSDGLCEVAAKKAKR